jgi:hypothetical protein
LRDAVEVKVGCSFGVVLTAEELECEVTVVFVVYVLVLTGRVVGTKEAV